MGREVQLENRDFVLVLDKSGSMSTNDGNAQGQSRWDAAKETTLALARKCQSFDPDGITVVPFNSGFKVYENTTPEKVEDVFKENEPIGGTVLAPALKAIFDSYLSRKAAGKTKANGEITIVVTDGQPSDESDVAKTIVAFGNKLDNADSEYGILFLQVGKDGGARDFLKRLDDGLVKEGAKHDIVDTKTMEELEGMTLVEALLGALND